MELRLLLFPLLSTLLLVSSSQAQINLNWIYSFEAEKYSQVMDILPSNEGIFIAYASKGAINDSQLFNNAESGSTQASLIKMDQEAEMIWQNTVVAKETRITNIAKAKNGDLLAMGYAKGDAIFESNNGETKVNCHAESFLFIARYSSSGFLLAVETIEESLGRRTLFPTSLEVSREGELYIALNYYGQLSSQGVNIGKEKENEEYSAILKFSAELEYIGVVKQWELVGTRAQVDVKLDPNDNLIISGFSRANVDLSDEVQLTCEDGSVYDQNTSVSFVAKYNSEHQLLWHQTIRGRNNQMITDLAVDDSGDVYFCGTFTFECLFSNAPSSSNTPFTRRFESSLFYAKLTSEGGLEFVKYHRSTGGNSCRSGSLCIDQNGHVHLTGSYNGSIDFDTSLNSSIGQKLEHNPRPRSNWRVNTRGNSAIFHTVWQNDELLMCQNLFELNGYPDAQYVRRIKTHGQELFFGGFYHIGKPTLLAQPMNLELDASGEKKMHAHVISALLPQLQENDNQRDEDDLADSEEREEQGPVGVADDDVDYVEAEELEFLAEEENETELEELPNSAQTQENQIKVLLYPNPTSNQVNVEFSRWLGWVQIDVISANGSIVYSQSLDEIGAENLLQINASQWANGNYYLVVSGQDVRQSFPLVKVK